MKQIYKYIRKESEKPENNIPKNVVYVERLTKPIPYIKTSRQDQDSTAKMYHAFSIGVSADGENRTARYASLNNFVSACLSNQTRDDKIRIAVRVAYASASLLAMWDYRYHAVKHAVILNGYSMLCNKIRTDGNTLTSAVNQTAIRLISNAYINVYEIVVAALNKGYPIDLKLYEVSDGRGIIHVVTPLSYAIYRCVEREKAENKADTLISYDGLTDAQKHKALASGILHATARKQVWTILRSEVLTDRQREVLTVCLHTATLTDAAKALNVTKQTVSDTLKNVGVRYDSLENRNKAKADADTLIDAVIEWLHKAEKQTDFDF